MLKEWAALTVRAINKHGTSDLRLRYKGRTIRVRWIK